MSTPIPPEEFATLVGVSVEQVEQWRQHGLLHAGPAIYRAGDYIGSTVNLASRVTSASSAGEILLTEAVADALSDGEVAEQIGVRMLRGAPDDPCGSSASSGARNGEIVSVTPLFLTRRPVSYGKETRSCGSALKHAFAAFSEATRRARRSPEPSSSGPTLALDASPRNSSPVSVPGLE